MSLADLLRWVTIAEAAVLVGFIAAILQEAPKFRAPPPHIYYVVASYVLLVGGTTLELYTRLGDPGTWRVGLAFASFGFGIVSMYVMWRFYRPTRRALRASAKAAAAARLEEKRQRLREEHRDRVARQVEEESRR